LLAFNYKKGPLMKILSTFLLSIALVFGITGCASSPGSRATGQVFDDVATTTKVKTAIYQAQGIADAAAINVDTYRGVVSLAGFVASRDEAQAAAAAARTVEGVKSVKNNLEVKPRQ
jgi:osmotically-inducible protein OsmY